MDTLPPRPKAHGLSREEFIEQVNKHIDEGLADVAAGRTVPVSVVLDDLKETLARMAARRAEKAAKKH